MERSTFHPAWWNEQQHGSAWQRVKGAMRRDRAQTKNDMTPGGPDLNQDVDDTLKQAAGKLAIPPLHQKTPKSDGEMKQDNKSARKNRKDSNKNIRFEDVELPLSYGYAARMQYESKYPKWDDKLESTLRGEWSSAHNTQNFDDVLPYVRRGFDAPHTK